MAQKNKCYAIIGDNGYGLSQDWSEITSYVKVLQKEMHHGFRTEEEAYEWLESHNRRGSFLFVCHGSVLIKVVKCRM